MSEQSPECGAYPETVRYVADAVTRRLGRPACCRQSKGKNAWWISDPALSFCQRGTTNGPVGYWAGYLMLPGTVSLVVVHSSASAAMFPRNLAFKTRIEVVKATARFRRKHVLHCGGSDRVENSVWLCKRHHRATGGRLHGNRRDGSINVVFSVSGRTAT